MWSDISRVLLVGGSTRMPMVSAMIREISGLTPDRNINPDEAVARGAAIFAGYQQGGQGGESDQDFEVTDVNSHSLGIQGIAQESLQRENVIVIPRNTALPCQVTRQFATHTAGQKSIIVQVLEGESPRPSQCSRIGRSVLRGLPRDLPKGYPVNIRFAYETNGRLHVEASLVGVDKKMKIELERVSGLSSEYVTRWRQVFSRVERLEQSNRGAGAEAATKSPAASGDLITDIFEKQIADVLDVDAGDLSSETASATAPRQPAEKVQRDQAGNEQEDPVFESLDPDDVAAQASSSAAARNQAETAHAESSHSASGDGNRRSDSEQQPAAVSETEEDGNVARLMLVIAGHIIAAALGLSVGYWFLCWLRPDADFLGIFS